MEQFHQLLLMSITQYKIFFIQLVFVIFLGIGPDSPSFYTEIAVRLRDFLLEITSVGDGRSEGYRMLQRTGCLPTQPILMQPGDLSHERKRC